ncbi:hypothetical protein FA10DRAFT_263324 [Acaromyces ingoldii]|uniref:Uncharacterized protein n=1 Tax=Acaromyces ingoldii TaxID=215250 RepID=A0A316YB31_9BASI|nr:hypothetical protein FA10DRAFT_263324 [Acaromyces ingoldii]PWN86491.1 hypothetical protein FA10DRAFT_263324 [Acaromyces ingoldii]
MVVLRHKSVGSWRLLLIEFELMHDKVSSWGKRIVRRSTGLVDYQDGRKRYRMTVGKSGRISRPNRARKLQSNVDEAGEEMLDVLGALGQVNEHFTALNKFQRFREVAMSVVRELNGFSRVIFI